MIPPYPCRSLQSMGHIFGLLMLSNAQQMKLLIYCVQPLIRLERFFSLFEDRRLGVMEIFEWAILIWFRPLMLLAGMSSVLRNEAQCLFHGSLISQKLCEELIHRRWRWWWYITIIAPLASAYPSTRASHLQSCNNKWLLDDVKRLQMNCVIMPN